MRKVYVLFFVLFSFGLSQAQVGINNPSPDDNSILDLKATDKGLLIPRLSTTHREAMSNGTGFSQGMMVYDTTLNILFVGYGIGASANTKWYAMNPWKTEHRTSNNADTAHMTAMTATGVKHGNVGIGTASPTEKLQVNGKVKATEFIGRGAVPIGTIVMWSGAIAPTGWALCNGSTVNGYKTPDLKGKFVAGYDIDVADYDNPGNLSTKGISSSDVGGAKEVVLTNQQMPIHEHDIDFMTTGDSRHQHSKTTNDEASQDGDDAYAWDATDGESADETVWTDKSGQHEHTVKGKTKPAGESSSIENRPPYYTLAYIMRVY